ncbi:MAG: DUF58 domain-containing protein [Thermodesulfovibrionales bacterium]|nr:DUF58 domain-containing protein [Thermodesulfovibrionales bacterium]
MLLSGFLSRYNFSKIDLELEIPDEIYANKETYIKIKLINNKKFAPIFLMKIKFLSKDFLFPFIQKKNYEISYLFYTFPKRGLFSIKKISLCSRFPFNFFEKSLDIKKEIKFIVFAEGKKCNYQNLQLILTKKTGEQNINKKGFDSELLFIRDYLEGDPLKYIHWKASAKTGSLKTKELSLLTYKPIIIDFDSLPYTDLEEKISCITFLINSYIKKGIPVGLKINNKIYHPGVSRQHRLEMLKILALYENEIKF